MSRYIDIEAIEPKQYENSEVELGVLAYDYDEINAMPFLDIVRCKDCIHSERYIEFGKPYLKCESCHLAEGGILHTVRINDDDFCSYGESI